MSTKICTFAVYVFSLVVPAVNSSETDYRVNVTDTVMFQCTATGIPPPTLSWFNGTTPLNGSDSRVTIGDASSQSLTSLLFEVTQNVTIQNTARDDTGNYSCLAENDAGNDTALFEFVVISECPESVAHIY